MHKREVSIALCGGIVGLIVGTGALVTTQGGIASIGKVSYDSVMNTEVLPRSEILRRPRSTSYTSSSSSVSSAASSQAPAAEEATAECKTARDMATAFVKAVDRYVPEASRNNAIKISLKTVATDALDTYCPAEATHAAGTPRVDNDCEKYGKTTDRYFTCMVEERSGRVYP